jgi:hypothetical protein
MKKICVVGSLSGIFTHSYIRGCIALGYTVVIVNTSNKIHYNSYLGCLVINVSPLVTQKINDNIKASIKTNMLFCYMYELYLVYKSNNFKNAELESFITNQSIDYYIFFWGTSLRKEARIIKRVELRNKRNPKYILDVATYPVRDYAIYKTLGILLSFDNHYFNSFDTILSHSKIMDDYLIKKLHVHKEKIKRFICSFPSLSYSKVRKEKTGGKINKIIFLGTLDRSSKINNISADIYTLAENGIQVYVQSNDGLEHENIIEFQAFTFEEIIDGRLGMFCDDFDGVLVAYGQMSPLREMLTYPTRFALALLSSVPVFVQKSRFDSLQEIIASNMFCNDIFFYDSVMEIFSYETKKIEINDNYKDNMESKLLKLVS